MLLNKLKALKKSRKIAFFLILATSISCQKNTEYKISKQTKIKVEKLHDSPNYIEASLELETSQKFGQKESDVTFNFLVDGYELGEITKSPNTQILANSKKGQHIHLILNNKPYSAYYDSNFEKTIPNGIYHLVAFLSRSYHESVKNKKAVVVQQLVIGDQDIDSSKYNISTPTLIYSRPKGEYIGADTEKILLDFFVLNTTLSPRGNKVKATINTEEFYLTEWSPYTLTGLPIGKNTIKLELVDSTGKLIKGPFNEVTRTITLNK